MRISQNATGLAHRDPSSAGAPPGSASGGPASTESASTESTSTEPVSNESGSGRAGQRAVQSVEVGGRLLLALAERAEPMTLKELATLAGMQASRAHPYLVSFGRLGLIEQDPATGRYGIGPAALRLGLNGLHQLDSIRVGTQVAEALARRIQHAVAICVWANFGPTVVRLIEGKRPLHVNMRAGTVMDSLETATGQAFAATLPQSRIEEAFARIYSGSRPPAWVSGRELQKRIESVRLDYGRHGVTRAKGSPIPGMNAFSAAAFDHEGNPALVLTALGHEADFPVGWESPLADEVRGAAREVSWRLGHRASHDVASTGTAGTGTPVDSGDLGDPGDLDASRADRGATR